MLKILRQEKICKFVEAAGGAETVKLTKALHATTETIRMDILELHKKKKLIKVHGGAIPMSKQELVDNE